MPPHHLGDNSALAIPLHALVDPMLQLHRWVSWNIRGTPQKVTNTTVTFVNHLTEAGGWKRCFVSWAMLQIWHHWIFRPPPPVLLQRLHDNVMLQSNCRIHTLRALKQMSDHVFTEKQSLKLLKHIGCYRILVATIQTWVSSLIIFFSSERRVSSERWTFNVWAVQYLYFGHAAAAQSFAASASGVWLEIHNNLKGRRGQTWQQTLTIDWTSSGFEPRINMH